ncbi:MAG: bacterial transcriptional activator domain-containing protein, partial [bacterium]
KSLYIELGRALMDAAPTQGRPEDVVRYGLRILERDPYDEDAHLSIVRALASADRHGEARRRYRLYVAALRELDVRPAPYPSIAPAHQPSDFATR